MSVRRLIPLLAPLGVAGAVVIATQSTAFAYPSPASSGKSVSGCTTVAQGASCTFVFQFFDSTGSPLDGVLAALGLDAVAGCSVTPSNATTANGGTVSATLTCAPTSGTGSEIVVATSGSVTVDAAVQIVASSNNNGSSLPNTSTAGPSGPNAGLVGGLGGAILVIAAGAAVLIVRRTTPTTK